ncbi:hypothetical protein EPN52_01760 [bacterium]|nr:MAG: hypothetical protein EPN52_01760 [bacterium]
MTAGLVVDALETAGIPTVVVGNQRVPLKGLPRVILTRYERGKNFGEPGDIGEHEHIAAAAVDLLRNATEPTLLDLRAEATPVR